MQSVIVGFLYIEVPRVYCDFMMVMSKKLILPFSSTSDENFSFGDKLNSDNMSLMTADFSL